MDYEEMILSYQEDETDDCRRCPHGAECKNQCMEIKEVYLQEVYPQLFRG